MQVLAVLLLFYIIGGYKAVHYVLYANKIVIGPVFFKKLLLAIFLGWLFMPIALLKYILF